MDGRRWTQAGVGTIVAVREEGILKRWFAVVAGALLVLPLAACAPGSRVAEGTVVRVAVAEAFTSYNPATGHGSAVETNVSVSAATNASFTSWAADGTIDRDESFGSVEVVSDDPLTVRYTVADDATWSDGVPVDAADLLLSWAANSLTLNDDIDPGEYMDPETGLMVDVPDDVVFFDGFTGNGLDLVTTLPEASADGRSLTLTFDEFFAEWETVFQVGLPAHVVARKALDLPADTAPEDLKAQVVSAIVDDDRVALAALSRTWTNDFSVASERFDGNDLVGTGPYTVSAIDGDVLTLVASDTYRGDRMPRFETVEVHHISDPLEAVAALRDGRVDVVAPQLSPDVAEAVSALDRVSVVNGVDGAWDLVQFRVDRSLNGAIERSEVRQALLAALPIEQLADAASESVGVPAVSRHSLTTIPGLATDGASADEDEQPNQAADMKKARGLLKDAGVESPTVCVLFDPANPRRLAQFALLRDAAGEAGFRVTNCSSPDWRNLLSAPDAWDVALYGLAETNASTQAVAARLRSGSPLNYGYLNSAEVDALLSELEAETATDDRAELLAELDEVLRREGWGAPLFQLPTMTVVHERVEGVETSPFAPTALHDVWRWTPADVDLQQR